MRPLVAPTAETHQEPVRNETEHSPGAHKLKNGAHIKVLTKHSRNTTTCTPGCDLPRDFDRHRPHTAKYLFYHGEPSPLLEHLTDNDVADLQRRGNIGGVDVP